MTKQTSNPLRSLQPFPLNGSLDESFVAVETFFASMVFMHHRLEVLYTLTDSVVGVVRHPERHALPSALRSYWTSVQRCVEGRIVAWELRSLCGFVRRREQSHPPGRSNLSL